MTTYLPMQNQSQVEKSTIMLSPIQISSSNLRLSNLLNEEDSNSTQTTQSECFASSKGETIEHCDTEHIPPTFTLTESTNDNALEDCDERQSIEQFRSIETFEEEKPTDNDLLIPSLSEDCEDTATTTTIPLHQNFSSGDDEEDCLLYSGYQYSASSTTMSRRRISNRRQLLQSESIQQQSTKPQHEGTTYQSPKPRTQNQHSFLTTFMTPTIGSRYGAMNGCNNNGGGTSSNNSATSNSSCASDKKEDIDNNEESNDWKRWMLFSTPPKRIGGMSRIASTPTTSVEYVYADITTGNSNGKISNNIVVVQTDRDGKTLRNNDGTSKKWENQPISSSAARTTSSVNPNSRRIEIQNQSLNNGRENDSSRTLLHRNNILQVQSDNTTQSQNGQSLEDFNVGADVEEEDHIIKVVDRVEDEWEEVAYDNLVPLEVRLALERNVFGWSHLSSDIGGHCLFTAGAFSITFTALYFLEEEQKRHRHANPHDDEGEMTDSQYSILFLCIRWIVSIAAAWSAFRMVRRRRRVWLRAPYGSMKYRMDEARRRLEVEQADNLSWIQRLKAKRGKQKLQKQLKKAESNFIQLYNKRLSRVSADEAINSRHVGANYATLVDRGVESYQNNSVSSMVEIFPKPTLISHSDGAGEQDTFVTIDDTSQKNSSMLTSGRWSFHTDSLLVMQSVQQDQIMFQKGPIHRVPYSHGGGFGAAPFMLANTHWISVLRYLMPDVYVELSRRVVSAESHKLLHWAENNPVVAAYATAHELENLGTITNLEWDVFLDPHLVNRVEIVLQERQKFLLSVLPELPTTRPMETLSDKYMIQMNLSQSQQNVVRYYESQLRKRTQLLVDRMLIAHGNIVHLAVEQTGIWKYYNYSRVKRTRRTLGGGIFARQWVAVYAESLRTGLYKHSNGTVSPNSSSGNSTRPWSPLQSAGLRSRSTSPIVSSTSLKSDTLPSVAGNDGEKQNTSHTLNHKSSSWLMESTDSICPNTSMAASVAILKHITKQDEPLGLVLDVKSRHVTNQVWACVVDILRESGIRVEGVGSFVMDEIRTLSKFTVRPVRELQFFHSAGDLQLACHNKQIRYGDHVFFNAGCLLWTPRVEYLPACTTMQNVLSSFDPNQFQRCYRIHPHALPSSIKSSQPASVSSNVAATNTTIDSSYYAMSDTNTNNANISRSIGTDSIVSFGSTIEDYKKRYNLHIGLYVQEFAVDSVAINMLVEMVNQYPEIYDLGLSWGGINGMTLRGIKPGRFTDTSGYWNQRYLGSLWNPELRPPV